MVNSVELERIMGFIEENPADHKQEEWICGTEACFAGWTCLLNDWGPQYNVDGTSTEFVTKGEECQHVREVAQDILGITPTDALILFWGNNTPDKLRLMVKDLSNGEELREHWVSWPCNTGDSVMVRLSENI